MNKFFFIEQWVAAISTLFFFALTPMPLTAQETSVPKEFYPKDYVVNPSDRRDSFRGRSSGRLPSVLDEPQSQVSVKTRLGESLLDLPAPETKEVGKHKWAPEQLEDGIPVYSIGLIVNAVDKKHFMEHFSTILYTAAGFDLRITQVMAVGLIVPGQLDKNAADLFSSGHVFGLVALEGHLLPVLEIPEKFAFVERSPTWLLNTAKGTIVIEGYRKIWEFLNKKGEFVDRGFSSMLAEVKEEEEEVKVDQDNSST